MEERVQVGLWFLQLVIEQSQQLPRQIVVPGRGGVRRGPRWVGKSAWACRLLNQLAYRLPFSTQALEVDHV